MQKNIIRLRGTKWKGTVINVLVAAVISLLINFSYFVMNIVSRTGSNPPPQPDKFGPHQDMSVLLTLEVFYYFALALILLAIFTWKLNAETIDRNGYWKRLLLAGTVALIIYFLAPKFERHTGNMTIILLSYKLFDPMIVLKCSFTTVVCILYGKIYELLFQRQNIMVENEKLKTENIQSRYDVLVGQMNPHFFFNSLNSLSMLVRENKNNDALTYIDQLSDTFRYIIDSGGRSITRLREELEFAEAYKYLFEIRYEGKFFVDIDIDESQMDRTLPTLSLQPLIENAVKHNTITRSSPLHISITVDGDYLVVSNPIAPKMEDSGGSGIGLKNTSSRYHLMTGKDIIIENDGKVFTVKLPLGGQ